MVRQITKSAITHLPEVRIFHAYPVTTFKHPVTGEVKERTQRITCRHLYLEGTAECPLYLEKRVKITANFRCTASREEKKQHKGPLILLGGYWSFSFHAKRYTQQGGPWDKLPARESEDYHRLDTLDLKGLRQELSRYLGNELAGEYIGELLYDEPEKRKKE